MQSVAKRFLPLCTPALRQGPGPVRVFSQPFPRSLHSSPTLAGARPFPRVPMTACLGGAALLLAGVDSRSPSTPPVADSKADRVGCLARDDKAARGDKVSREWIAEQVDRLADSVSHHPVLSHPFFDLLEQLSKPGSGYTPAQIDLITANFFRACLEVIPAIAECINVAVKRGDAFALAKLAKNLNEEAGDGQPEEGHRALALVSLNAIRKLHDCPDLSIEAAHESPVLLPAVKEFIEALKQLNHTQSDHESLGAEYADERVSLPMMTLYFKTFVEPFKSRFTPQEWSRIQKYWDVHIGGTEERHAKDLLDSLKASCQTAQDVEKANRGAAAFLGLQVRMLDAVYLAAKQAGTVGQVVPIPSEPLPARQEK